jgi:hypothetical protein
MRYNLSVYAILRSKSAVCTVVDSRSTFCWRCIVLKVEYWSSTKCHFDESRWPKALIACGWRVRAVTLSWPRNQPSPRVVVVWRTWLTWQRWTIVAGQIVETALTDLVVTIWKAVGLTVTPTVDAELSVWTAWWCRRCWTCWYCIIVTFDACVASVITDAICVVYLNPDQATTKTFRGRQRTHSALFHHVARARVVHGATFAGLVVTIGTALTFPVESWDAV